MLDWVRKEVSEFLSIPKRLSYLICTGEGLYASQGQGLVVKASCKGDTVKVSAKFRIAEKTTEEYRFECNLLQLRNLAKEHQPFGFQRSDIIKELSKPNYLAQIVQQDTSSFWLCISINESPCFLRILRHENALIFQSKSDRKDPWQWEAATLDEIIYSSIKRRRKPKVDVAKQTIEEKIRQIVNADHSS